MQHMPADSHETETAEQSARNARYGIRLFLLYALFYAAFVLINAFRPEWMDVMVFAGLNLATVYGLALIVAALVLALIYGWLCRASASSNPEGAP